MLKKNRSAPNTAVIPVLYIPHVREAVEWLTTALPFIVRLRNSDTRRQLLHSNGAIVVAKPAYTVTPLLQHCRALGRTPSPFVSRRSTNSLDATKQPVLVYSLNPQITCMANANARSSTHGDIRGRSRRRFSIPTQPTGAANSLPNERVCHDPMTWLISVALDRMISRLL